MFSPRLLRVPRGNPVCSWGFPLAGVGTPECYETPRTATTARCARLVTRSAIIFNLERPVSAPSSPRHQGPPRSTPTSPYSHRAGIDGAHRYPRSRPICNHRCPRAPTHLSLQLPDHLQAKPRPPSSPRYAPCLGKATQLTPRIHESWQSNGASVGRETCPVEAMPAMQGRRS